MDAAAIRWSFPTCSCLRSLAGSSFELELRAERGHIDDSEVETRHLQRELKNSCSWLLYIAGFNRTAVTVDKIACLWSDSE